MSVVENPDGSLWIDIKQIDEVDDVRRRLGELGVPMAATVPDPDSEVTIEDVEEWSELYPRIVTRNGPEPGVIVDPAQIPEGHTLVLESQLVPGPRRGHRPEVVKALRLIRGLVPARYGNPVLYPARAPR